MAVEYRVLSNDADPIAVQWRDLELADAGAVAGLWSYVEEQIRTVLYGPGNEVGVALAARFRRGHDAGYLVGGPDGWRTVVLPSAEPPTPAELVQQTLVRMRAAEGTPGLLVELGDAMSQLLRGLGHGEVSDLWDELLPSSGT